MDFAKQIIDQRVNKILEENAPLFASYTSDAGSQKSLAFLLLGVAAYLDIDIAEASYCLTDGAADGGFDAAYIAESGEGALNVVLFQSKYTRDLEKETQFSANAVQKSVATIKNIFDPKRAVQLNERSRKIVSEIQSFIADGVIPYVSFVMLNNGAKWNQDAQNHIDNEFSGQKQVEFVHFNHTGILKYVQKHREINDTLTLTGVAIKEDFNYKEVILGRISVEEIARILESYGDDLLDRNIRKYLGVNAVNRAIRDTLLDDTKRANFFFYNNGITMICTDFKYNALQKEDWKVHINGMQIINGGQTCKTIYQTLSENKDTDYSQITVLLRLYSVGDDKDVVEGITRATNSQNPVDFRDLKANDATQQLLEQSARDLGYSYKRKRDNQSNTDVIPSSVAAEAVFAVWREKPHLAKYKKSEFFNIYYNDIFNELNGAQMIIAVLIYRMCDNYRKKLSPDKNIQAQRPYSQYLLSSLVGKILLSGLGISIQKLSHVNFLEVKTYFENNHDAIYEKAEKHLVSNLEKYFSDQLFEIDGRSMAAAFRRFDFVEKVLLI
jgi:hypothetical protein